MLFTRQSYGGAVTAPHHLAAQAGMRVLREGGNAIEAMIAAAACIPVVYPHMNSIGGDGFWLIAKPGQDPIGIDACGRSASLATRDFYADHDLEQIPSRGPLAALTVAGTISGWALAHEEAQSIGGRLPLTRLLEEAIFYAKDGIAPTDSQISAQNAKHGELVDVPGYADSFLPNGGIPTKGERFTQKQLAATLSQLAEKGLSDFYLGELAEAIAGDLEKVGSPLRRGDLENHRADKVTPLSLQVDGATLFNMPPPTQGLASLLILGIFEHLKAQTADSFEHVHSLVEATKQAFLIRDKFVTDPAYMTKPGSDYLDHDLIAQMAGRIDPAHALPWPQQSDPGDTVWMGAIDSDGCSVSFIQSIYWEFGSGVVLPQTGILWQNRGTSFALEDKALNCLEPNRKPFHTLNPAMAHFTDGRRLTYGTMGGDGQPQTQAAIFSRFAKYGQDLQTAITAPRWLLGRTWGSDITNLRVESGMDPDVVAKLKAAGHDVDIIEPFSELVGHAGAIVRYGDGRIEGASDPRSDGAVASF